MIRIVGLGPGDPDLLTLGSVESIRAVGRAVTVMAPPELVLFLETEGIAVERTLIGDQDLFLRGGIEIIDAFVERIDDRDLALGVLGNPLSDFPGLPVLLRAAERRGIPCEIIPGMPRATLSAAIAMPLVPLPPLSAHHSWDGLVEIMARLRRSCPWDREQTHRSLIPYLIEETYEVVEAIEHASEADLCEELGDLLLQIVFHAQLATERGRFSIADVIDALANKMIRRHPHVFGDTAVADVSEVWQNWEALKAQEAAGQARQSKLDGIPKGLGSLQRAQKMQEKAARVGFDWPDLAGVTAKLAEELAELEQARRTRDATVPENGRHPQSDHDAPVREEVGDVLFTVVNLARALGIDAEGALRGTNEKFYRRFTYMERRASAGGKALGEMSLEELEELWQLAKVQAA
jgi:tetrapyrrole methylase family protein/MazG family protein